MMCLDDESTMRDRENELYGLMSLPELNVFIDYLNKKPHTEIEEMNMFAHWQFEQGPWDGLKAVIYTFLDEKIKTLEEDIITPESMTNEITVLDSIEIAKSTVCNFFQNMKRDYIITRIKYLNFIIGKVKSYIIMLEKKKINKLPLRSYARGKEKLPSRIIIKTPNGTVEIDKSDIYFQMIKEEKDWESIEIEYAWQELVHYDGIVHDWWRFAEGTVEKLRLLHGEYFECDENEQGLQENHLNGQEEQNLDRPVSFP